MQNVLIKMHIEILPALFGPECSTANGGKQRSHSLIRQVKDQNNGVMSNVKFVCLVNTFCFHENGNGSQCIISRTSRPSWLQVSSSNLEITAHITYFPAKTLGLLTGRYNTFDPS